ncbi:MAG: hypothetical protein HKN09_07765 [Saprospiraceae bacterium]|nr:hypothetical protein [Saprospiraceae bacterium]
MRKMFKDAAKLDPKSLNSLVSALEQNNLQGFDYIEFKQSTVAIDAMNLDKETAIKSTFATASTMGLTKSKLPDSAKHYIKVLNNEKDQFDLALKGQVKKKIDSKKDQVNQLKSLIKQYQDQIKQLQEEIDKSERIIANADEDMQSAKNRIEETKSKFETAFQSVVGEIKEDIDHFKQYL